eukprot:8306010-Lingulodinium_polyedra.AAC.1
MCIRDSKQACAAHGSQMLEGAIEGHIYVPKETAGGASFGGGGHGAGLAIWSSRARKGQQA